MIPPSLRTRAGLALSAALLASAAGCDNSARLARADAAPTPVSAATRVEVVTPAKAVVRRLTEQPGQIEAVEVTPIHAKLAGYVRNLSVDIGDRVAKGRVLAELWAPEVEAELQQKRAQIEQAAAGKVQAEAGVEVAKASLGSVEAKVVESQAGLRRSEADLELRQIEFDRTQTLVNRSATTVSLLDEARSKFRAAEATRDASRAAIKSAEAALGQARAELDQSRSDVVAAGARVEVARSDARRVEAHLRYAQLDAPFDGVVTRRNVDTGHLTMPGATGPPLFVVARIDVVTVVVDVPEIYAAAVGRGDAASVRVQALGGRSFPGKVTRTAEALDQTTRTLRAEVDLPNPDGVLQPGLYAYVTITAEERPDALTIPTSAVVRDGTKTSCVCVAGGRAARKSITIGLDDGVRAEVLSGLDGTEAVVKTGGAALADGQKVEAAPAAP